MVQTDAVFAPVEAAAAVAGNSTFDKARRKLLANKYPKEVWYFIACFIFLVGIGNVGSRLLARRRQTALPRDPENRDGPVRGAIAFRRLPLAAVNAYRILAFRCAVPVGKKYTLNVAELLITATYIIILFVWSLINTTTTAGKRYDPTYYSNRAASIAAVQTPLIVALGMKNNLISLITGVSFEKLSYLHRMCARSLVPLIWLHAAGRIQLGLTAEDGLDSRYIRCGILAATALTFLCIVTLRPVRRYEYEAFFVTHFLLVFIILLSLFFHTRRFQREHYIWPSFVLWGLDRLLRLCRLVLFNHSYFGLKSGLGTFDATAEVAAPGFVRLRVRRPSYLRWSAGQCALLTMPGVSLLPFESHPFTIANADAPRSETAAAGAGAAAERASEKESAKSEDARGKELVFVVRARQGFTKRLMDVAQNGGPVRVFVDGPYGAPPSLRGFDTVVFIAGGSGVTFTSPMLLDLVRRAHRDPSTCRRVIFLWSIRHADHINLVYADLAHALAHAPASLSIDARIHITSPEDGASEASSIASPEVAAAADDDDDDDEEERGSAEDEKSLAKIARLPRTTVARGRPDVEGAIDEACALARGSVSVNVCGPASLSKRVRGALCAPVKGPVGVLRGGPSVELHVEQFGIA